MKKNFSLIDSNKNPERKADAIKHEVKKYLTRERKKKTPENVDYWDFDCKIGDTSETAIRIEAVDINQNISKMVTTEKEAFYLEILAKPGFKRPKS